MFQIPAPTRYDLNFTLFGTPVRVHPLFWMMGVIFGLATGDVTLILMWVIVVFVSILLHEFGYTLAMRVFGWDAYIVLYMFGGLAVPMSSRNGSRSLSRSWFEQVIISLAGPFAGFLFAAIVLGVVVASGGFIFMGELFGVIPFPSAYVPNVNPLVNSVIGMLLWINIFWGLVNLMPVFPLDGGQAARAIFVRLDPWNGVRKALWLSLFAGGTVAIAGLVLMNSYYIALLFGLLAMQSYQMLQMSR